MHISSNPPCTSLDMRNPSLVQLSAAFASAVLAQKLGMEAWERG